MNETKSAAASVTIWGAGVAVLAGAAQLAGYTMSPSDQAALVNLITSGVTVVTSAMTIVGGLVAIWGRLRATKQIASPAKAM
jgi:hypothetical protein